MAEFEQPAQRRSAVLKAAAAGVSRRELANLLNVTEAVVKHDREKILTAYFSPQGKRNGPITMVAIAAVMDGSVPRPEIPENVILTAGEKRIAERIKTGATNNQIAKSETLSVRTVKDYVKKLRDKFHAPNRVALAVGYAVWEQQNKESVPEDPEKKIWQNPNYAKLLEKRANGFTRVETSNELSIPLERIKKTFRKIKDLMDPNGTRDLEEIVVELIQSGVRNGSLTIKDVPDTIHFTSVESDIVDLLFAGQKNKDIADALGLTEITVRNYIQNDIYKKVDVRNLYHLVGKVTAYRKKQEIALQPSVQRD